LKINSIASTVTVEKSVCHCEKFYMQARNILTNLSSTHKAQPDLQLWSPQKRRSWTNQRIFNRKSLSRNSAHPQS